MKHSRLPLNAMHFYIFIAEADPEKTYTLWHCDSGGMGDDGGWQ